MRRRPSRWSRPAISSTSVSRTRCATRSRSASTGCRPPRWRPPPRWGCRGAQLRIWVYRIPSLIGATGAVLLTYWAALAFVTRRGAALAALMMCSCVVLNGRSASRQDRRHAAAHGRRRDGRARTRVSVLATRRGCRASALDLARDLLDGTGRRHPAQGPVDPDVRGAGDSDARDPRPQRELAVAAPSGLGPDVDAGAGAAMVHRDLLARRRYLLRQFARRRHAGKTRRAGIAWRAARILSAAVLDHVLAGRAARGHGGAGGVAGAARARRAISAGLAGAVLDRVRTGADQAAALRAAALSGGGDPRRGGAGAAGAGAQLAEARRRLVVRNSGAGLDHLRRHRGQADPAARVCILAFLRRRDDRRPVRVVAL